MIYKKKGLSAGPTAQEPSLKSYVHFYTKNTYNIQEIKDKCIGLWPKIISFLAPELKQAIYQQSHHVPCPVHGGKDGLRTFADFNETGGVVCNTCGAKSDGIATLKWISGWDFIETIDAIESCLENIEKLPELKSEFFQAPIQDGCGNFRRIKVQRIIDDLIPLDDPKATPALLYLKNRGLQANRFPADLYYHQNLSCQGVGNKHYPALVALITDVEDKVVGLHRTYITDHGEKAPVPKPKMMLSISHGLTIGGSIKLFQASDTLAVAEGIETALAIHEAIGIPVWATATAVGMTNLQLPESISTVSIWFDEDKSKTGEKAALKLADRLIGEGKNVKLLRPPIPIPDGAKGVDWLDVLNFKGGKYEDASF